MAAPEIRWTRLPLDGAEQATALETLSPTEDRRFEETAPSHREGFLAGRLMLRRLAGEMLGVPPAEVAIEVVCLDCGGPHGRPILIGTSLNVSLSHTAGLVAAAASWDAPLGIDIESTAPATARLDAIAALTGVASVPRWTRVEAVLKADGRGLRVDPSNVSFVGDIGRVHDTDARYALTDFSPVPGVTGSLALRL